ncbi:Metal transporter nramp1 [Phytophthora citrophthora]|uniref:Metal transporter nramp1 n=1 Tax=Phytophthora citrophthora TaxID=4793 RepID=A0AAD9GQU5_9STRA|nr:Metal transporter nramp1 [Phytophthora citrophthora]
MSSSKECDVLIPINAEGFPSYNMDKTSVYDAEAPDEDAAAFGFSWRTLWAYAGPGWLMSIAYVDPGNLESDLQAGAYGGYQLIWVLLGATVMGYFLQVLAARLGVVTGKNLAEVCTDAYPRWASLTLWIMAEIAIVGSDIQEVLGSSIAFQVLFGFPLWLGCLITGFDTFTFLLLHRYGIRKLEAFFVSLIAIMLVCFCANLVRGDVASVDIARGFVPHVERYAVTQAVGIVGAVIMPHNIFLHSALVQSRQVNRYDEYKVREANKYFAIESGIALFVSFLINLAVLAVFAKGFFSLDCTATFEINGLNTACVPGAVAHGASYGPCRLANGGEGMCQAIGLSQAGVALSGMLGDYADIIWAIGLLAAGQSSTMTGTYAGQFVMEGFLNLHIAPWKRVALTRCVSLVPAMTVAILSQRNSGDSDTMDEMLNVLQSIQLPFALLPILNFTSSSDIMGDFVNSKATVISGWILGGLVCVINMYLVITNLEALDLGTPGLTALISVGCLYFGFLLYLMFVGTSGSGAHLSVAAHSPKDKKKTHGPRTTLRFLHDTRAAENKTRKELLGYEPKALRGYMSAGGGGAAAGAGAAAAATQQAIRGSSKAPRFEGTFELYKVELQLYLEDRESWAVVTGDEVRDAADRDLQAVFDKKNRTAKGAILRGLRGCQEDEVNKICAMATAKEMWDTIVADKTERDYSYVALLKAQLYNTKHVKGQTLTEYLATMVRLRQQLSSMGTTHAVDDDEMLRVLTMGVISTCRFAKEHH